MKGDVMTDEGPCLKISGPCDCGRPIDHEGRHECDECRYWWDDEGNEGLQEERHDD